MLNDVRYGIRMLLKSPGFTVVVVITLALGIGANAAIFSVINAVLLRPLPYQHPEGLVLISETTPGDPFSELVSSADFVDWKEQNQVFEQLSAYTYADFVMTDGVEPLQVTGERVSANFFQLLGTNAFLGRTFLPEEDKPGSNTGVVLSHKLWERHFASDPHIVGRTLTLNGASFVVIGVMPNSFRVLGSWPVELWVPMAFEAKELSERRDRRVRVVARLKPDISIERSRSDMTIIARRLQQQYPESNTDCDVQIVSLAEQQRRNGSNARLPLFLLQGAVALVLLIACTNITNLLLARAAERQKEIIVRAALGASRWRLIRQSLAECILLGALGGALGLLLASWMINLLVSFLPKFLPWLEEVNIDSHVLFFSAGILVLTVSVFGFSSALCASKTDLSSALKEGSRTSTGGVRYQRILGLLVVCQVAISMVLLNGAGLMVRSLLKLRTFHSAQHPETLLTMQMSLSKRTYPQLHQITSFYDRVLQSVKSVPGVQSVGILDRSPLGAGSRLVHVDGVPPSGLVPEGYGGLCGVIGADYFRALQIPLSAGRYFEENDARGALPAMIINEALAHRLFPNSNPVGSQLTVKHVIGPEKGDLDNLVYTIVGIVRDVKLLPEVGASFPEGNLIAEMYIPYRQASEFSMLPMRFPTLSIRTAVDPMSLVPAVRKAVWSVDKDVPIYWIMTLEQLDSDRLTPQRLVMLLMGMFATLALVLAAVGLYGVSAYSATQRTHEIGIRRTLGARSSDVLKLVVKQSMILTLVGVGIGLAGSLALTKVMASQLFGVSPTDPATFVGVSLLLSGVVLLACYFPARRATRVDPMVALRYE
jgi:putative ABC transport system permease protein